MSSAWKPERRRWGQTWVDSSGTYLDFTGNFRDGRMALFGCHRAWRACKQRMVWYNIKQDEFDWNWERSDDEGETWRMLWQISQQKAIISETFQWSVAPE